MVLLPSTGGRVRICISLAQALTPSPHEYAYLGSPGAPHLPCQAPLLPQQLSPPFLGAHLGHSEKNGMHMCVRVRVYMRACVRVCVSDICQNYYMRKAEILLSNFFGGFGVVVAHTL